ncbi:GNAT family N-acetyltransferase [Nocardia sp. CS682]|uniref:GNAT family N-acetyltransferase n=1 Tax=Nocardia sp. CS682 TaxID=1047172 RepID=UPI001074AC59|nr:GNAT family N-acetyltransferase [Nocardia sp. CS682]QBS39075.1 GNAT family N-acetyltransferase [Nocardia sp. CS682]
MSEIVVRPAEEDDLDAVARLRWRWVTEKRGTPEITREEFTAWFVVWAKDNDRSHRCWVVADDGVVLGMAWLAVIQRVPTPHRPERASGDLQCVYVVPERRDTGLGGRLIDAVLAEASRLGLERVTVHSSDRAINAYARHGFTVSPRLLQVE